MQAFTHITNHDLQEPLRKIQIISSYISEKEIMNLSVKGREYFGRLKHSAYRMQRLIADLLAYSRTSTTMQQHSITDIAVLTHEINAAFLNELDNINAIMTIGEMCSANIIPQQVKQLLHNLIGNSIKYHSPERQLNISISAKLINGSAVKIPELKEDTNYCHISVADNGMGFEQQYSEKIFDLFQRLQERSEHGGTGIGLGIVKKIVENHNGYVKAKGMPGEGAVFDIYLEVL